MIDTDVLIGYIFIFIPVWILLTRLLLRWIFSVEKRERYQEAQIRLLLQIAIKLGADPDEIHSIAKRADLPPQ